MLSLQKNIILIEKQSAINVRKYMIMIRTRFEWHPALILLTDLSAQSPFLRVAQGILPVTACLYVICDARIHNVLDDIARVIGF